MGLITVDPRQTIAPPITHGVCWRPAARRPTTRPPLCFRHRGAARDIAHITVRSERPGDPLRPGQRHRRRRENRVERPKPSPGFPPIAGAVAVMAGLVVIDGRRRTGSFAITRHGSCLNQFLGTRMTWSPAEARKTGISRTNMRSYSAMSGGRSAKGTRYGVILRCGSLGPERQPASRRSLIQRSCSAIGEPFDFLVAECEIRCAPIP